MDLPMRRWRINLPSHAERRSSRKRQVKSDRFERGEQWTERDFIPYTIKQLEAKEQHVGRP
jgi:hypothetical protein